MNKWTIYDRNGKVLHESVTGYDGNGKVVEQDTLEYSGKWMGDCFVTVSFKSAYPIDFQIGDYIVYRGERFTINYDPTVVKKSSRGTYGEGFTYDSVKFNALSNELTDAKFHDWVLSDNKIHYSSLPNFSFYAKDMNDLADRLQACMDRWCKDNGFAKENYWIFYTPGSVGDTNPYDRTIQRAKDISTDETFLSNILKRWKEIYGDTGTQTERGEERLDRTVSVDNQTVWQGMALFKSQFGLNFIIRGREVIIGAAGVFASHIFKYGKNNGLYEVDKQADTDQKVVTRLHAYGSSDNLPTRYYAELDMKVVGHVEDVYWQANHDITASSGKDYGWKTDYLTEFSLDIPFSPSMFTKPTYQDGINQSEYDDPWGYFVRIAVEGGPTVNACVHVNSYGSDATSQGRACVEVRYNANGTAVKAFEWQNTDPASFRQFSDLVAKGRKMTFVSGVDKDKAPVEAQDYTDTNLPNNMAVMNLMLPGFPKYALSELCKAEYVPSEDTTLYYIRKSKDGAEWVVFHKEPGEHVVRFSTDRHDPYIVSPNADSLGYRDDDIFCTEENDDNGLKKVYPSVEDITEADAGVSSSGEAINTVVSADTIKDNGVYPKTTGTTVPGFKITVKNLGFDLRDAIAAAGGDSCKISMKDGFCGGREFDVPSVEHNSDGTWTLHCKRSQDGGLDIYYPYSYNMSVGGEPNATEPYQICKGDHYVLLGISLEETNYVWAASVKLLAKAIHWLCKNDYSRYTYSPKIDEIYMARQDEEAKASGGKTKSLHDTLKEGDLLWFQDDDLRLDGKVYIDQLVIKENGNNGIPTYDVTLRNEVLVGTIQRIQNKVDSIANDIRSGNVGSGVSPSGVESIVNAIGGKEFLSKTHDDSTPHKLTMGEAEVKGDATVGGDAKSSGFLSASDSGTPAGWALRLLQGIATGELDDLIVRRNAKVRDLTVTGAAHFFKLIIDEIKSAGGSVLLTPANGFVAERVTHHGTTGGEDERYILYWRDSDGEKTIDNQWMVGDFAVCMTANLKQGVSHNAGNKTWWCKVVDSGNSGGYNYISLDWYGRAQGRTVTDGGKTFTEATSSGVPEAGDNVAMLGSVATDKDGHFDYKRQSAIYLAAYDSLDLGLETPFLAFYYGIDDFCLSRHRKTHLSRLATDIVADKFTVHSDDGEYPISVFYGDWNSETAYPKAGVVRYNGCTWTSLKDGNKGNTPSASSAWWVSNKGEAGRSADAYDITFRLNGVAVTTLNYDTLRATDGEVAIEAAFSNNGAELSADEATLGCYDERGELMGRAVTGRDSGGIVVDGGDLYLSPDCNSIQCSFAKGGRTLCTRSLTVIRNGSDGVTIAKTEYKYSISDAPDASIDWDGIIAYDELPQPTLAPGKYLYVMTIVTYSDGTVTSTVTISYCGTDGDSVRVESTSVTYCVTKDGRQPDDSRFTSTDVPAVAVGDYLWCKTVVTYSDGKSTKSYAVSRVGSDGEQGYSLHFAYADNVAYSGTTPTVTNFSTTRKDSSQWLGVNRSQDVADPTDPKAYQWTKIKGEAGKDGQNGRDGKDGKAGEAAVHYELRDNGSRADISILSKKITLRLSLSYDFYKVEGSRATKTGAEEVVCSIGGKLAGSGGTYTLTGESTFDSIDDLPASAIVTAKVGGAVVATAVCKVSMSKRAYFDVDSALGSITERVSTAEGEIGEIRNTGKAISAKVNSLSTVAAPNLLLNSGFSLTTDGIPNYWEVWDDNKAKPAVTISGDNCKVEVKAAGSYQGIKQTRKMLLHSPLKLTFSCIAKGSGTMAVMLHKIQGTTQTGGKKDFALKADAQQLSCTFELSQYIDSWRVMIGFASPSVGDNVTFYNPKLEIGDVATPWCENGNDRVLATGMDIENGLVEFTANKFNIRDNYGNQMFAVETGGTGGTASRVKLRNLAMSGLAIRDMVTMETWGDVRKYFTFDTKEFTSGLRFETCLNTFRLSKRDGKSCLLGREEGETADSIKMFNVLLPCQDYFEPATDEYLAYMEEAMRYVGNRIVILNESGYRIAVYGRQEVTHMTTYTVWDSDSSTPAKVAPTTSNQPQDLRPVKDWDGSAQGYYIPTDKIHDQKRDYTMQKVWTSDEYWVVPDGSMAVMECVCDICAPYDTQGATVSILEQPPMGQSVFWKVSIGKILRKGGAA